MRKEDKLIYSAKRLLDEEKREEYDKIKSKVVKTSKKKLGKQPKLKCGIIKERKKGFKIKLPILKKSKVREDLKTVKETAITQLTKPHSANEVITDIDKVVELVGSKDKVSLFALAKQLKVPVSVIEAWARILDEEDVLKLVYPKIPMLPPYLMNKKVNYEKST